MAIQDSIKNEDRYKKISAAFNKSAFRHADFSILLPEIETITKKIGIADDPCDSLRYIHIILSNQKLNDPDFDFTKHKYQCYSPIKKCMEKAKTIEELDQIEKLLRSNDFNFLRDNNKNPWSTWPTIERDLKEQAKQLDKLPLQDKEVRRPA